MGVGPPKWTILMAWTNASANKRNWSENVFNLIFEHGEVCQPSPPQKNDENVPLLEKSSLKDLSQNTKLVEISKTKSLSSRLGSPRWLGTYSSEIWKVQMVPLGGCQSNFLIWALETRFLGNFRWLLVFWRTFAYFKPNSLYPGEIAEILKFSKNQSTSKASTASRTSQTYTNVYLHGKALLRRCFAM